MMLTMFFLVVYKHRVQHHEEHHAVIDCFKDYARKMGKEIVEKSEAEIGPEDMREVDCVVAMGGDHTFLRASALIWDKRIPILGINTNRHVYTGVLNPHFIDHSDMERQAAMLLETMEDDHSVGYDKRSRIMYERIRTHEN